MKTYIKPLFCASVFGLALSLSACSQASSADVPETAATEILVGNWDIQAESSHIQFSALQEGKAFTGEFGEFSGIINFDPDSPQTGSVRITVPLKSVDAGSNDRNSTLPEKVWFSLKAHPTAIYTSSDIAANGDGFIAKGELTLKGISVPLDLPFDLEVTGDIAVMTSTVEMDRTKWSVGAAPWDTDEWVSRSVKLDLKVTAQKIE
jgi:polyisoprenoid-binding protein YceI